MQENGARAVRPCRGKIYVALGSGDCINMWLPSRYTWSRGVFRVLRVA